MLLDFITIPFKLIYKWYKKWRKKPNSRRIYVSASSVTIERDFTTEVVYSPQHNERRLQGFLENTTIDTLSPSMFLNTPSPIKKRKNKYSCCICLESLSSKKTMKMNECLHEIHVACIKEWFKERNVCPLCRTNQDKLRLRLNIIKNRSI